jgi:glycosyltransferase involved in cell wall biosynthesis
MAARAEARERFGGRLCHLPVDTAPDGDSFTAVLDQTLLASCDALVVTERSTFGYVAHLLAGAIPFGVDGRLGVVSRRPDSRSGLYRASRAALVTPLRDGMNLVAKEYIAAQDPEDPGVLILSRFAGAARECQAALLVNPYDPDSVAAAIGEALPMPLNERRERHEATFRALLRDDIETWADRFLRALAKPRGATSDLERIASVGLH